MRLLSLLLSILLLGASGALLALPDIQVQGLFSGRAVLNIDGNLRLLKEGETSPEGIELISADTQEAILEYEGERFSIGLTSRISSQFRSASPTEVRINVSEGGHFRYLASINHRQINVLVDTGATLVAMNGNHARQIGIDYANATQTIVSTAAGRVPAYNVVLDSVSVGPITIRNVEATIIEGNFPETVLLGNSFLSQLNMTNENGVLLLQTRF